MPIKIPNDLPASKIKKKISLLWMKQELYHKHSSIKINYFVNIISFKIVTETPAIKIAFNTLPN